MPHPTLIFILGHFKAINQNTCKRMYTYTYVFYTISIYQYNEDDVPNKRKIFYFAMPLTKIDANCKL